MSEGEKSTCKGPGVETHLRCERAGRMTAMAASRVGKEEGLGQTARGAVLTTGTSFPEG